MPLTNNQFDAFKVWLRDRDELRDRLDFIFDGLNNGQENALKDRIKSDLENEYTDALVVISGTQANLVGEL